MSYGDHPTFRTSDAYGRCSDGHLTHAGGDATLPKTCGIDCGKRVAKVSRDAFLDALPEREREQALGQVETFAATHAFDQAEAERAEGKVPDVDVSEETPEVDGRRA